MKNYAQEVYIPAPNAIIKFNWNRLLYLRRWNMRERKKLLSSLHLVQKHTLNWSGYLWCYIQQWQKFCVTMSFVFGIGNLTATRKARWILGVADLCQ